MSNLGPARRGERVLKSRPAKPNPTRGVTSAKPKAPFIVGIGASAGGLDEAALHAMYAQIIDASADAIYSYDFGGCVLTWNAGAEKLYGYAASEIIGQDIAEFIPADRAHELSTILAAVKNGEPLVDLETERLKKDGSRFAVQLTVSPLRNGEDRVIALVVIARDITARRRTEKKMRESEQLFRVSFENSPVSKAQLLAATGRFVLVNKKMCELTGYSAAELYELTPSDITLAEDRASDAKSVAAVLSGEANGYEAEKRYVRKDGGIVWVHIIVNLLRDGQGRPDQTLAVIQDITERKLAEARLRESELRLAAALRAGELGVHDHNLITGKIIWDETLRRIWGASAGETIIPETFDAGVHPDDLPGVEAELAAAFDPSGKRRYQADYRVVGRDGITRWVRADGDVTFADQVPVRLVGTARDISELKRTEQALRESEAFPHRGDRDATTGLVVLQRGQMRFSGTAVGKP